MKYPGVRYQRSNFVFTAIVVVVLCTFVLTIFPPGLFIGVGTGQISHTVFEEDVKVTGERTYSDEVLEFHGDLIVLNGGILRIESSEMRMNCGNISSRFYVLAGGTLVIDGSIIMSNDTDDYEFRIDGNASIRDTDINQPESLRIFSRNVTLERCTIQDSTLDGLYIKADGQASSITDVEILRPGGNGFHVASTNCSVDSLTVEGGKGSFSLYSFLSNLIISNSTIERGGWGAVYAEDSDIQFLHCTFNESAMNITESNIIVTDQDGTRYYTPDAADDDDGSDSTILDGMNLWSFIFFAVVLLAIGTFMVYRVKQQLDKAGKRKKYEPIHTVENKRLKDIEKEVETEERKEGPSAEVYIEFGDMAAEGKRHAEALRYYRMALELDDSRKDVHYKRGKLLEGMNRFRDAMVNYNRAMLIDRHYAPPRQGMMRCMKLYAESRHAAPAPAMDLEFMERLARLKKKGFRVPSLKHYEKMPREELANAVEELEQAAAVLTCVESNLSSVDAGNLGSEARYFLLSVENGIRDPKRINEIIFDLEELKKRFGIDLLKGIPEEAAVADADRVPGEYIFDICKEPDLTEPDGIEPGRTEPEGPKEEGWMTADLESPEGPADPGALGRELISRGQEKVAQGRDQVARGSEISEKGRELMAEGNMKVVQGNKIISNGTETINQALEMITRGNEFLKTPEESTEKI